jgi:hypothetical protein
MINAAPSSCTCLEVAAATLEGGINLNLPQPGQPAALDRVGDETGRPVVLDRVEGGRDRVRIVAGEVGHQPPQRGAVMLVEDRRIPG